MKYIRIGDIPPEERSGIYRGDSKTGEEKGVSVYDCVFRDNRYYIVLPPYFKEGVGITYEGLMQEVANFRYPTETQRKVYLVKGDLVGYGSDGEPLLRNVRILRDITEQFIKRKQ